MTWNRVLVGLLAFATSAAAACADGNVQKKSAFVVHEWGTFLAVQGSDGVTLGGMVDSDEVLPGFVESRSIKSWDRAMMALKMETPVTYFYSDKPRTAQVRIDMPRGVLTHWYPFVKAFGPDPRDPAARPEKSFIEWKNIEILPTPPVGKAPALAPPALTWGFARQTDAALLRVIANSWNEKARKIERQEQFEKFLFYRGLGTFALPLSVRASESTDRATTLTLANESVNELAGICAIHVENGTIAFGGTANLAGRASRQIGLGNLLGKPAPLAEGVPLVKQGLVRSLIEAGLYEKEAVAMVNTWEKSYFRTDGLRILYILPRPMVDDAIPIKIKPEPDQLVRVMVGRVEVLTPDRERQIATYVSQLGAREFVVREAASKGLAQLGRIGEPALRRVARTTTDPEIRVRAARLIQEFQANP